jgi:heavy metal sensor kinase
MFDFVRTRLTLWYVCVLALVLVAFSLGVYLLIARNLHDRLDNSLRDSIAAMERLLPYELDEGESFQKSAVSAVEEPYYPNQSVVIFDALGNQLSAKTSPNEIPASLPVAPHEILDRIRFDIAPNNASSAGNGRRVASRRLTIPKHQATYLLVASQSLDALANELALVRRIFVIAIPLALALAGVGGWLLARKSLAPVVAMSERARRISGENVEDRLPVTNPRDELGRLAITFNEMLERLTASLSQQRQFMTDASHELRTPLHVIRTSVDVTLGKLNRDKREYREALEITSAQVRRLSRIVEDMFLLARADAGRRPLERLDFYLDELLGETARAANVLAASREVNIVTDLAPDSAWRGDEGLMRQMMLNLLDNAIKFTPPGGRVELNLARHTSGYEITVSDTGVGIPRAAQDHVFDRFFRANGARSQSQDTNGSGAGLGLSIARWIAEAHEGRLELRHSDPHGSIFVVTLPG